MSETKNESALHGMAKAFIHQQEWLTNDGVVDEMADMMVRFTLSLRTGWNSGKRKPKHFGQYLTRDWDRNPRITTFIPVDGWDCDAVVAEWRPIPL